MAQSFSFPIPKPTSKPSPFCTFFLVVVFCTLGLYILRNYHPIPTLNASDFRDLFLSSATNYSLSSYLRALTLHPHLAGTDPAVQTSLYVQSHFRDLGLDTHMKEYNVLLSYPTHASLSAHFRDGGVKDLPLTEVGVFGNGVVRPYHAYSPSGSAFGRAVFVNYGREEDYGELAAQGVSVAGCVGVVRRGEASRNAAVEKAAEKGVAAVLMYTESEGFSGGVERGTVMNGLGDPLTPGWAGVAGGERLGLEDSEVEKKFPEIPSLPISPDTAEAILRSLEGVKVPHEWRDTLKYKVGRVGPGPIMLNFTYQVGWYHFPLIWWQSL